VRRARLSRPAGAGAPARRLYGITPEDWREFDRLKAFWHARRREFASARESASAPSGPLEICARCGQEARFGYRNPATNTLSWFCAEHRLAQSWADARR
jgi:hypothetical protein